MKRFILSTLLAILVTTLAYTQPNSAVKSKRPDSTVKLRIDTPLVKTYVVAMPQNDVWTDRFINLVIGLVGVISGAFLSYYYTV